MSLMTWSYKIITGETSFLLFDIRWSYHQETVKFEIYVTTEYFNLCSTRLFRLCVYKTIIYFFHREKQGFSSLNSVRQYTAMGK